MVRPKIVVPPGGFAGFSQQTQAVQALFQKAMGKTRPRKKRAAKKKTATRRAAPKKRATSKGKRLVKGSPEAARHMAKLRKMRKK